MLLPAWHVPELKKWIKIPDGADREDSDDSDGDGENALPALNASELAVTRSIALSIANCRGTTTSVKAWMLMAQMSDLTSYYVEKMLSHSGLKLSQATLRRAVFQAKVDAEYFHRAACDEDGVPHEDVLHDDKGVPNEDEDVLHEDEGVSNEDEGVLSEDESWPNEDEGVPHEGVNEYEGVPNEYEGVPNEDDSEDGMHFEYEDDPVFHENDMEERNTQTDEDIDVLSEEENNEVIWWKMQAWMKLKTLLKIKI
ncbi:hypothetical protein EMCRGX_G018015 [Ephydatia muelleri]